jgi:hypothetical protein
MTAGRDPSKYKPGTLVDHKDGTYSLIYSSFPDVGDVFEQRGLQGGGCTWHGMVVHLLEENAPEALDALDFDCEAGMFSAISDSLPALAKVAEMLRKLEDRELVCEIAENVDLRQYD